MSVNASKAMKLNLINIFVYVVLKTIKVSSVIFIINKISIILQSHFFPFSAGKLDHSNYDCFVFIVLSHGVDGLIYGTDSTVSVETLTRPFRGDRCRSLAGKPKLFFFQVSWFLDT